MSGLDLTRVLGPGLIILGLFGVYSESTKRKNRRFFNLTGEKRSREDDVQMPPKKRRRTSQNKRDVYRNVSISYENIMALERKINNDDFVEAFVDGAANAMEKMSRKMYSQVDFRNVLNSGLLEAQKVVTQKAYENSMSRVVLEDFQDIILEIRKNGDVFFYRKWKRNQPTITFV